MRQLRHILVALAATAGLAACSGDATTSPADATPTPSFKVVVNHMAPDSTSADFTVTQSGGTFQIGPHAIYFPPNSICDPATSGYGVSLWDTPCSTLNRPVRIHAEVRNVGGLAFVDFSPELRFAPTRNANRWVWIWMRAPIDRSADSDSLKQTFNILWSPAPGLPGIDESLTDPTLKTRVLSSEGLVYRRIKHFSGYQISVGFKTDDADGLVPGLF